MDRIVTGDETWVHHYDPESKQESMQWHKKGTDPPKKFKVTPSAGKLMATVFWDSKGILLIEYKKKVKPSTPHPTLPLCIICGRKLKRKDGVNSQRVCCFFMTTLLFTRREFPRLLREIVVSKKSNIHPIVQTLAPSDYCLFPDLKKCLRGKRFSDDEELKSAINAYFAAKEEIYFFEGLKKLISRCNKCIDVRGDYIEK